MKARIDARRLLAFVVVLVTTMIFSAYFSISSLRALRDRFNSAVDKTAAKMKLGGKHYQVGYVFEPERQRARGIYEGSLPHIGVAPGIPDPGRPDEVHSGRTAHADVQSR
jgi:hypothetical protein